MFRMMPPTKMARVDSFGLGAMATAPAHLGAAAA